MRTNELNVSCIHGYSMIDWLSLKINLRPQGRGGPSLVPLDVLDRIHNEQSRILCINRNGEEEWSTVKWESVRSDTHQVVVRITKDGLFYVQGSPARLGQNHNVFGTDDIIDCFRRMVKFVNHHFQISLPLFPQSWICTRIDVTNNYLLSSLAQVRQVINLLSESKGGRYRVEFAKGMTRWNSSSQTMSAKAYAKGPHIRKMIKQGKAYLEAEYLHMLDRLLRLELVVRSKYWRELERCTKPWYQWSGADFQKLHHAYFTPLIGNLKVNTMKMDKVANKIIKSALSLGKSKGYGEAAYKTLLAIRHDGYEQTEERMMNNQRSTWYIHKRILVSAGYSLAQLRRPSVVPMMQFKSIDLGAPVRSFDELKVRAA